MTSVRLPPPLLDNADLFHQEVCHGVDGGDIGGIVWFSRYPILAHLLDYLRRLLGAAQMVQHERENHRLEGMDISFQNLQPILHSVASVFDSFIGGIRRVRLLMILPVVIALVWRVVLKGIFRRVGRLTLETGVFHGGFSDVFAVAISPCRHRDHKHQYRCNQWFHNPNVGLQP